MTRLSHQLSFLAVGLLFCACDSRQSSANRSTPPPGSPPGEEMGDFPLGRDLIKSILEENDERLSKMREDLDRLHRELDRLDASTSSPEHAEALKKSMIEMLDKQENDLRKINEQIQEIHKGMESEKN